MKIALVLTALTLFVLAAEAVNIKKKYCGNQEYVGNPGSKYPHLHCGKSFITLSKAKKNHNNLQGKCNVVKNIIGDPNSYYGNAGNVQAITNALTAYENDSCPTLLSDLIQHVMFKLSENN